LYHDDVLFIQYISIYNGRAAGIIQYITAWEITVINEVRYQMQLIYCTRQSVIRGNAM